MVIWRDVPKIIVHEVWVGVIFHDLQCSLQNFSFTFQLVILEKKSISPVGMDGVLILNGY